ncbi:hypothetical protein BWQ96_01619 [Gracilariopsis chorda]|uniref:Uncharacterized protein n=1 Tax=Gracilariopsis chorda TaxID=448386 RepID=A0A2V3J4Z7_9FLOR|nr:hypothetical protein BWQ96_01619 [Gracilariopsis chorda]|eukprot:PXF48450.1 hypothetical protein BWQ96_01619 [Gracilariopsis chorda]
MVEEQIRPGEPGRPRYVVFGGDQPSHRMFCKLWAESLSAHRTRTVQGGQDAGADKGTKCPLHEWMIPFPGFFHAEKQAMYALCKEMLDGLGIEELARCAGFSPSILENILKHAHARNNRPVLLNLACAMIIHLVDITLLEDASLSSEVANLHKTRSEKKVSSDGSTGACSSRTAPPHPNELHASLYSATHHVVIEDIL